MEKKRIIEEKANRFHMRMSEMQRELERDLIEYIEEHGELDFTQQEWRTYTTMVMWGETAATYVEGVRVKNGVLLVVAEDGQEYDRKCWTNDTLIDICYDAADWCTVK